MAQLSATVNTRQPSTLPSNTVQNPKNDTHYMAITTRGGKQTIDPPMPSGVEKVIRYDDTLVEVSSELEDKMVKDLEVPPKSDPHAYTTTSFPTKVSKKMSMVNIGIL